MTPPVVVKISVKSAIELKLLVQNAMCEDESESSKSMREEVFNALPSFQDLETVQRILGAS